MLRYLWCGSIETTRNMHPQAGQDGHSVRGLSHDFGGGTCVLGMIGPCVLAGGSKIAIPIAADPSMASDAPIKIS